jgi:hypothetical protein
MRYLMSHWIGEAALDGVAVTAFEGQAEAWTAEMNRRGVRLQRKPLRRGAASRNHADTRRWGAG